MAPNSSEICQWFIDLIEWKYEVQRDWKGANWKYSNQIEDVIPDYLVIIVGYMMQIMSKSDVVVTCKVRNEFWIKLDQVETTNQENVQNLLNLLLLFFLLLSGGPNKPINVQSFANFLFFSSSSHLVVEAWLKNWLAAGGSLLQSNDPETFFWKLNNHDSEGLP